MNILYVILFCCGNPPPVESSMTEIFPKEKASPKDDVTELKKVTESIQKDISALSVKVDDLEKAIKTHIKESKDSNK